MQKSQRKSSLISLIIVLFAVLVCALMVIHRQQVIDTVRAWQYEPSARAIDIRDSLGLTQLGRLYYDSSQPRIETADGFNQSCPQSEPNNPVVGCYSSQQIYIYDVRNEKLEGIEETTAAHELLHAAYERMDEAERADIDAELEKVYESVKTKELEARMKYYQVNEPGEETNELHSILGTEFTQLGTKLETHYAKYFTDRAKVLAYYQKYQAVFASIIGKLDTLAGSINQRTMAVNDRIAIYKNESAALSGDIRQYNSRQSGNMAKYNELVARQTEMNSRYQKINKEISAINKLRKEYDTLRKEYEALSRSINSSLEPAPTLKG